MLKGLMILFLQILILVGVTLFLFNYLKNKNNGGRLSKKQEFIVGIIFGLFACAFTQFGTDIDGSIMNIRDSAPIIAGLYFGPYSAIISGIIGAVYRYFSVLWGVGKYTQVACSLGTLFSGVIAAIVKKYILQEKTPGVLYGFSVGLFAEVTHLLLVFITHPYDIYNAMHVMTTCGKVMIPLVSIASAAPALLIKIKYLRTSKEKLKKSIVDEIQTGLLVSVLFAYLITNAFVIISQRQLADVTAFNTIETTVIDVQNDAKQSGYNGEDLKDFIESELSNWHIGSTGFLCLIDKEGNIVGATTDSNYNIGDKFTDKYNVFNYSQDEVIRFSNQADKKFILYSSIDDYYIVAVYPANEADIGKNFSILITAFLEIVILGILFFQIFLLNKKIVVYKINNINTKLTEIANGNLDVVINENTNIEFEQLSDDINSTVRTMKEYIHDAEKRIDSELQLARDIQMSALPGTFPYSKYYDLYGNMIAAKHVGGDFYDYYKIDDDRIAFMVADVSGKGIPASLFMMKAKTLIKGLIESGASPEVAFTKANTELCANNDVELFVTAWLGILDIRTGVVTYVNAGHNPPIIGKQDRSAYYLQQRAGFVLGGLEGIKYKESQFKLEPGEGMLLYTDGVTEATNVDNELYGEDRLLKLINECTAVNMRYLCKIVKADVDDFVGEAPQFDDITILGIKRKSDLDIDANINLIPNKESIGILNEFVDDFVEKNNISIKTSSKIMVIVDEIYSNIVNYSRANKAIVTCQIRNGLMSMSFYDDGIKYDPLDKEDPDITLSADEREIGGLGIYMVKKMTEDIKYTRSGGLNILDIIIYLE